MKLSAHTCNIVLKIKLFTESGPRHQPTVTEIYLITLSLYTCTCIFGLFKRDMTFSTPLRMSAEKTQQIYFLYTFMSGI